MRNEKAREHAKAGAPALRRHSSKSASSRSRSDITRTLGVKSDITVTTHENVYRGLRDRILFGGFLPGSAVTLRGLAEDMGVSPMPIREAVRRLIAERALKMQDNRRVLVPPMTAETFEQIVFARKTLEPELAARAMDRISPADIRKIAAHDKAVDRAMAMGDVSGYMENNYRFHFAIYQKAGAETLLALVESIWLQFGPFMRMSYNRWGTSDLEDQHQAAIAALQQKDRRALRAAIGADVSQGMSFIGETVLRRSS
ncbi:MAG: GntR family transcriptional regulator [Rhizobiales bacterium]|nr:GntR family transcriptional regulator [Hyphomicrobiales bacterium]